MNTARPPEGTSGATAAAAGHGVPAGFVPVPAGGRFGGINGPIHMRCDRGSARFGFRVEERHVNLMGFCHGGMIATFCDMLLPLAAHAQREELARHRLPTVSLQIDYLAPVGLGAWVQGEAQVIRTTRSLVFAQGLVSADGEPVARTNGILKIGPPISGSQA